MLKCGFNAKQLCTAKMIGGAKTVVLLNTFFSVINILAFVCVLLKLTFVSVLKLVLALKCCH